VELAYRQQIPIRVIIVDGKPRNAKEAKPKSSHVRARMLDPVKWAATKIDSSSGDFLLIRGENPTTPAVGSPDVELAGFEGQLKGAFVKHRWREAKMRRAKIAGVKGLNGGRLICEVPECGFDFVERYGELGTDYAQVHHLLPLSKSPKQGREVKLSDLAIVCANCHAMIHRGGECRSLVGLIP
jgi:5-methylcytosine-specific restriction endonuclease McrA